MDIYSKSNPPKGYYVYAYLREDDSPYYIGKGLLKRAWDKNHSVNLPKDITRIVILESNLSNIGALALERRYIRWYGRKDLQTGILRNRTEGGEGPSSRDRKGILNPMFGRTQTSYQRELQSARMSNIKKSDSTKLKMSIAKKDKYDGMSNPNHDKTIYTFYNKLANLECSTTQYEFRQQYNLDQGNLSKLISGKYKSIKNWELKK